jgi:hypothetical protein
LLGSFNSSVDWSFRSSDGLLHCCHFGQANALSQFVNLCHFPGKIELDPPRKVFPFCKSIFCPIATPSSSRQRGGGYISLMAGVSTAKDVGTGQPMGLRRAGRGSSWAAHNVLVFAGVGFLTYHRRKRTAAQIPNTDITRPKQRTAERCCRR